MNKGVIAGVVSILVAVMAWFGIDVSTEEQQTLMEGLTAIFGAGGMISLIWGWIQTLKNKKKQE
ncbi:hypothetical protein [Mailhella massiliensis]|uniref:Uncharacterized protein n=1 Tax=Mailhella massiliensis TaxID=1903261 RepID=A0A921AXQ5_9BACT|nr:hypothetical protein [Mailhella massiliensis]HJD97831.1 hypothetical protein [Mailhella massiliensis]